MDSDGRLFCKRSEPTTRSRLVALYEGLAAKRFADLGGITTADLDALARIHAMRLGHYVEERRMHFCAFALVGLAVVVLLPAVLTLDAYFLPLAGVELLLLTLMVPYAFYYRKYEERARRMMRESFLIENARLLADEQQRSSGTEETEGT